MNNNKKCFKHQEIKESTKITKKKLYLKQFTLQSNLKIYSFNLILKRKNLIKSH